MIQTLSLLGSTGSIGTQALDIIRRLGIQVKALAAYRNIERWSSKFGNFSLSLLPFMMLLLRKN